MTAGLSTMVEKLAEEKVEFILVGGMAAVLHGAPIATQDIDVVHRRTPENVSKLLAFLEDVDARYRGQPRGRILRPTAPALGGSGHNNLMTSLGPLDVLCEVGRGEGYEQLLPHTEVLEDGAGNSVHVVTLAKLIEIKLASDRPKDRLVLPILMKLKENG
jgi:hypothetical protein